MSVCNNNNKKMCGHFVSSLKIVLLLNIICVSSYNILGVFPLTGRSHFLIFEPIMKGLALKGHNVTVLSHFPLKKAIENYKDIVIGDSDALYNDIEKNNLPILSKIDTSRKQMYQTFLILDFLGQRTCEIMFQSKNVQDFLKQKNEFDLVITEYFNTDCALALTKQFNSPIVRVHSATLMPWTDNRYANPLNTAYMPNNFLPFSDKMTFLERVENTLVTFIQNFYFNKIVIRSDNEIVGKYFGEDSKTIDTDIFKDSILLVNTHFSLNLPRPLVPNVIEIGGISVGKSKSLPKDIEKWINESKDGIIYFSFGSVIKGYTMPDDKRKAFIKAFKRLPQRVIWKWENETMEGKSDNIMIGKWMPQFDILSHPNVKAFISHGGLLGTMEAVHCGVPIMVMPQFGDQHTNAKALESVGGGVVLYMNDATEETIYESLKRILEPSFQAQAKELSERFRDRPMPPLETAIYWVEYVARHKGAHFMKTAAVNMPFYQYYLLDVIAFIIAVLSVFLYLLYFTLKCLLGTLRNSFKKPVKQKKS